MSFDTLEFRLDGTKVNQKGHDLDNPTNGHNLTVNRDLIRDHLSKS